MDDVWPVASEHYTAYGLPVEFGITLGELIHAEPPCRVYWGSHGCDLPRGHLAEQPHDCGCCECDRHPDEDSGCVAKPPYYGEDTKFYGEDAEELGLPLVEGRKR